MSTLAYAQLTTTRDEAQPNSSTSTSPPGVKTYVDALAALVPAEVLTLHALMLSVTTKVDKGSTTITAPETLYWAFFGLLVVSVILYAVPRLLAKKWDAFDWLRAAIPPLAFVGWTMLQRTTAFDAVLEVLKHEVSDATRTVIALFLAVVLGAAATALAYKADAKQP
jgi:FtsH-binding integral membrane protein